MKRTGARFCKPRFSRRLEVRLLDSAFTEHFYSLEVPLDSCSKAWTPNSSAFSGTSRPCPELPDTCQFLCLLALHGTGILSPDSLLPGSTTDLEGHHLGSTHIPESCILPADQLSHHTAVSQAQAGEKCRYKPSVPVHQQHR